MTIFYEFINNKKVGMLPNKKKEETWINDDKRWVNVPELK
jgi:hypothetical protein